MLTNPSTLGVFERNIVKVAEMVHDAGGLLVLRRRESQRHPAARFCPGDMGFDVIHMNLHKTFSTPHGGGGPGSGAIGVGKRFVAIHARYRLSTATEVKTVKFGLRLAEAKKTCRSRIGRLVQASWVTPVCCCGPMSTCAW